MKVELREYLEKQGLQRSASAGEAWKFYGDLDDSKRSEAHAIRTGAQPANSEGVSATTGVTGSQEATRAAEQAVVAERKRVESIRSIFDGDCPELMQRAVSEGWTAEESATRLLAEIKRNRSDFVGGNGPAIHDAAGKLNKDSLRAAMVARNVSLDSPVFESQSARGFNIPDFLRKDINSPERQQAMEHAHQFSGMSMVDLCRASLELEGHRAPYNRDELIRSAFEKGTLEPYFSTNINTRVLMGYAEQDDTTVPWTSEVEFADFRDNDMITPGKTGALTKHARGKVADSMDRGAEVEPMRIARYSGKWHIDEIDIINNRFGSGDMGMPEDMGRSARQLRPDLVYSILLANANLKFSGQALFNAECNNDNTGAPLTIENLEAAITAMSNIRQRNRPLNIMPRYLIVPPSLKFEAMRITRSGVVDARQPAAGGLVGTSNVIASDNPPMVIADTRLDVGGVVDPDTETAYAGSSSQWFLAARPGESGAKTVTVAYLSGRNRAPMIRPFTMSQGKWGLGWDINHDIGAKALGHIGLQRNNA